MKTVFTIGNSNEGCDILLLEIGEGYCCFAALKGNERAFRQIKYFSFDEYEAKEILSGLFDDVKKENCEKVLICSAFPQSMLSPKQGYQNNSILLDVIYDLPSQKYLRDDIPEWQLDITYALPAEIFKLIREKFRFAEFVHVYTPFLKVYNGFTAQDQVDIHFSLQNFRVIVKKNRQIQLAQTYSYKTPLDVVYYLLKICYEFQLQQPEVLVIISGLVEEDSAMYAELHNYFLNLHFAEAPSYSVPENEHPQHYFTSLYNLAACVS